MTEHLTLRFRPLDGRTDGTLVLLANNELGLGAVGRSLDKKSGGHLTRAAKACAFDGSRKAIADVLAPAGLDADRVLLAGTGTGGKLEQRELIDLGGTLGGALLSRKITAAAIVAETGAGPLDAHETADLALGALLRSYSFKKYRTKCGEGGQAPGRRGAATLTVLCKAPDAVEAQFVSRRGLAEGVFLARDLVNEPANALGPVEFAERAVRLTEMGVEVKVLGVPELEEEGMKALLAVGQGSVRPSRLVVMQWLGADSRKAKPIAFVGKGVVFDTGGISMKPAKGMEDMKGDMAGAACVTGLMHALAARKAVVNAVGVIGLVENMPSATAQRPGDIIGSMSGQTIEVLNTDAEGRLVLADALTYVQKHLKPKLIVDLATLTGAIMVALGKEHAGLFANNDALAKRLEEAGKDTGERLWRMPLDPAYDKEIDSKNADMKNIGGAYGGAITAAQFLARFVGDVPWAHLDIAGTAMASNRTEVNDSWGSGFGVRLLDRLVAENYEG